MAQAAAAELKSGRVLSRNSRVGTQREYEAVTILRSSTNKNQISDLISRMQGVIEKLSGRLLKIDSWGMRVLAYPIKHDRKGIYLYWRFLGGSDMVAEFERNMRLIDTVMRFYTVLADENVDPDARPSEVTEQLLEEVSDPGPDPEELARQAAAEAARKAAEEAAAREAEEAKRQQQAAEDENEDQGEEEEF